MKVKVKRLLSLMDKRGMTSADLAREMEVELSEVEKLLNGEAVDEPTARKFIYYLGADEAQRLVDWEAIDKENPLADSNDEGSDDE